MATGNAIVSSLYNASVVPTQGAVQNTQISFGGTAILQACPNVYLEVLLNDPTNTGEPASFSVQMYGGIGAADTPIASPITSPGLLTLTAPSPITQWQAVLTSLSGGVSPSIIVRGVAGE